MDSTSLLCDEMELESVSHFWRNLFVSEKLASKLMDIIKNQETTEYNLPEYGKVHLEVRKGNNFGDNFMSDPCCCYATTETGQQFQAFVKVPPKNPFLRTGAFSERLYYRESNVYQHFLRYLREIRSKHGVNSQDLPLNVPEIYYCNAEDLIPGENDANQTVIVMEELKCRGFQMASKYMGCHFQEAQLTLKSLANFHALSIAFLRSIKDSSGNYALPDNMQYIHKRLVFEEKIPEIFRTYLPIYSGAMKTIGLNEVADWLENQDQILSNVMEAEKIGQSGPLSCIIHGDCWNNNMLYRYDEQGYADEMRLVDWQLIRFGHPAMDILHFLFTSTSPEMRDQHFDQLLTIYYNTLKSGLTKLDINIEAEGYSEEIFRQEVKQRYLWGMVIGLIMLPGMLEMKIVSTLEEFEQSDKNHPEERTLDEIMTESKERIQQQANSTTILQNTLLSHRVIQLVVQVKKALE